MKKILTCALLCMVLLSGCGAVTPYPTATPTFLPTATVVPSATPSPLLPATITPTPNPVKAFNLGYGLTLVESAAWEDDIARELFYGFLKSHINIEERPNRRYSRIVADVKITIDYINETSFKLVVTKSGNAVYETSIANMLGGFPGFVAVWTFENHWAIEIVTPYLDKPAWLCDESVSGQIDIIVDGESIKQSNRYDAVFGFQTLDNKPFYFYSDNCTYGISYDGVDISLKEFGYEKITFRNAWPGLDDDPVAYQNAVAFWVIRGGKHYSALIGAFSK